MMLALDHIVIAAKDPKEAAKQFERKHNIVTIQGGRHENWGTYNYLAYFSNDCYIEWLGIFDKEKALHSDNPLVAQLIHILESHDEYAYQFALRTNKMNHFITHFEDYNIPFVGPIDGSRKRPDGSNLEWKMLFPATEGQQVQPFLIEWGKTKNIPADRRLINRKQIPSLTLKQEALEDFKHIYQIPTSDHQIKLENGTLSFINQKELFKLKVD